MWSDGNTTMNSSEGGFMLDDKNSSNVPSAQRIQNVVPFMIEELLRPEEALTMCGMPVNVVTFVGTVLNIEEQTTKISYMIKDDTGTIKGYLWTDEKNVSQAQIDLNSMVRVYGLVRANEEERHVFILKIVPIKSPIEVTVHKAEVTYVKLKEKEMMKANGEGANFGNSSMHGNSFRQMNSDVEMMDTTSSGLSKEQSVIFKIIQSENDSECGIERSELKMRVPKNLLPSVDTIIDFLASEGHIYTTKTDDHFKTT